MSTNRHKREMTRQYQTVNDAEEEDDESIVVEEDEPE